MIKYVALAMLLAVSSAGRSQSQVSIKGTITDTNGPLEFTEVTLHPINDSTKTTAYTFSNSTGQFYLDKIKPGQYKIKFALVGYTTKTDIVVLEENSELLLNIALEEGSTEIRGVTVTAQKKLIEKTTTGFIVNAGSNITQAGGTATDILKSTPTINVDAEGAVTLRGKTPMFLINGRNTTIKNLNQIAASSIESIEVINNANSKYDANAESGIINIRMKKNKQEGGNGNFSLGLGRGAKGRLSSAALLNHKTEKWNIGLGYDNRFAKRNRAIDAERTNFELPDFYNLDQGRHDDRLEQLQNLNLTVDYTPDSIHTLSLEITGNTEGQDNLEDLNSFIHKVDRSFVSNTNRYSAEYERSKVAEIALNYEKQFTDEYKSFTAVISSAFNDDKQNTNIDSKDFAENTAQLRAYSERTHNYEKENLSILKLDYGMPAFHNGIIEMGYKGTSRFIKADYETADKVGDVYTTNTLASNVFNFDELVNAAYIEYNSNIRDSSISKWRHSLGLRAEQTNNSGATTGNAVMFKNNYLTLFPSAGLAYYFNETSFMKLNYARRINRPEVDQFNPFIDITDALNPHGGNPNLKPELVQNLELGYNKEWAEFSCTTNIFYRRATNTIRQFQQLQSNGVVLRLPVNIGNLTSYGTESILSGKVSEAYDFNASISLFESKVDGSNISNEFVNSAFSWNAKLINNITPWNDGKFQVIGSYIAPTATPQGRSVAQRFVDIGFQQKLSKNGNARIGLTIIDVFNTLKSGYNNVTPQFENHRYSKADTRAIMLVFGYTFRSSFKDKMLDNKFSKE